MKLSVVLLLAVLASAQDRYAGTFQGDGVTLEITAGGGMLTFQGQKMPAKVAASGAGTFELGGRTYAFTLAPEANGFVLSSEGAEYHLKRQGAPPPPSTPPPAQAAESIVGSWRNATGYAKFNPDGTGVVDGTPGRYEIRGNQITMIGAAGQVTLPFEVRDDVLTFTVNGNAVRLNREKPEMPGVAGVRQELVGKWCWVSTFNATSGGARQSNRCITLNGNGTYTYYGLTDSYNPYGGATSQSSDSGTWTATENSLIARSSSGKVATYRLEKRNHPKNVRDPMIVLDGQPFVTFYNKPPW